MSVVVVVQLSTMSSWQAQFSESPAQAENVQRSLFLHRLTIIDRASFFIRDMFERAWLHGTDSSVWMQFDNAVEIRASLPDICLAS